MEFRINTHTDTHTETHPGACTPTRYVWARLEVCNILFFSLAALLLFFHVIYSKLANGFWMKKGKGCSGAIPPPPEKQKPKKK